MITVVGLEVRSDARIVHDRLLDDFPRVSDVLATTIPETILIVYKGTLDAEGWFDSVTDTVRYRRSRNGTRFPRVPRTRVGT